MMKSYDKLTLVQLAAQYNSLAKDLGKPTINKFSDRESGLRRTEELAAQITTKPKKDGRGRPSKHAGKKIFPIVDGNPRQAGSHSWHAFKIIQENPGILYEDYVKAGGGSHHLRWDIEHKFAEVKYDDTQDDPTLA